MREGGASKATVGGRDGSVIRGERWSGEEEDSAGTPTRLLAREGEATRNGRTGGAHARGWAREKRARMFGPFRGGTYGWAFGLPEKFGSGISGFGNFGF